MKHLISLVFASQILGNWEEYVTIKQWKKGLKYNSHKNKLSQSTYHAIKTWMPLFIKYTQKTPDDLIEEALNGKENVKARLSDFCSWCQEEKGMKINAASHGAYSIIRGFYSHNNINTQKIRTPKVEPSEVQFSDDQVPLFEIVEVELSEGTFTKQKIIKRDFLKNFFDCLSTRDKIIALCIESSGMDSSDVLDVPLAVVRYQDPSQERIFIRDLRNKTGEVVSTFFSKEASKLVRNYVKLHRVNAKDTEPIFVESGKEFKINFHKKHGRPFNSAIDEFSFGHVDPHNLSRNFRIATKKFEKILSNDERKVKFLQAKKQSPLRPKRFRKLFSAVCDDVGIPVDIKRVFMGKSDPANKPYSDQSRQDLEIYYEKIEPKLMLYSEPKTDNSQYTKLAKEFEDFKSEMKAYMKEINEKENQN